MSLPLRLYWTLAGSLWLAGCSCPTVRIVHPLPEDAPAPGKMGWFGSEGDLDLETCKKICGSRVRSCTLHGMKTETSTNRARSGAPYNVDGRAVLCAYIPSCPGGRAPADVALAHSVQAPSASAAWLAKMAELELVSVQSFLRLAVELSAHGAPHGLIRRALRSAREEQQHAAIALRLAHRAGAQPPPAPPLPAGIRSFEQVLLENEAEGRVRERYSAMLLAHQARHAGDTTLRRALTRIAPDEQRHAALAEDIARWGAARSTAATRRRLDDSRVEAEQQLISEAARPVPAGMRTELGLPDAERAVTAARALGMSLSRAA